jgi:hypothetical protein
LRKTEERRWKREETKIKLEVKSENTQATGCGLQASG